MRRFQSVLASLDLRENHPRRTGNMKVSFARRRGSWTSRAPSHRAHDARLIIRRRRAGSNPNGDGVGRSRSLLVDGPGRMRNRRLTREGVVEESLESEGTKRPKLAPSGAAGEEGWRAMSDVGGSGINAESNGRHERRWESRPSRIGAGGGNRTHTGGEPHGILSPARLPVSPLRRGQTG